MPLWEGKEVKNLSDTELQLANWRLQDMKNFQEKRKNDPRYDKRFENQKAPEINPAYIELVEAVQSQMKARNL